MASTHIRPPAPPKGPLNNGKPRVNAPKKAPPISPLSVKLFFIAIPILVVSSAVLYKRIVLGEEKRSQKGEFTPDGGLHMFSEAEVSRKEQEKLSTKIFGGENRRT